jgi:hypothetical protein
MNSLADAVKAAGTLGIVVGVFVPKNPDAKVGRAGADVVDGIARTNSAGSCSPAAPASTSNR